ncbi:protein FAM216B [Dromiciops gliroides]|uniref:protein FAM216B n=1 Tax=Dromiciops gliroides TaxID=33562 RepID=UPI001CC3E26F|nr:protein FAM216B [Dromiciops gliroides]XP_043854123.1 protein FAM216B [Dromiciops gliroides]
MNHFKKKQVGFRCPIRIPGKRICSSLCKPVSSSFVDPIILKGLNPGQRNYLKSIMKIYDSKPQWKNLKRQYFISLIYKYILGYISKEEVMSYMTVMDQYTKKGPIKCKSKIHKFGKTSLPSSSRKSLSSHSYSIIKYFY